MSRRLSLIGEEAMRCFLLLLPMTAFAQETVSTRQVTSEIDGFLKAEIAAHIADIKTLPQTRVVGALTTGEYSCGTFLRSAAVNSQLSGEMKIAGKDWPKFLGQVGR